MRRLVALIATCASMGCNRLFGLTETSPEPVYIDAPADAPFTCPTTGGPPSFGPVLQSAIVDDCSDYTISESAQRVVATCDVAGTLSVSEGGLDGPLAGIAAFAPDGAHVYSMPRLAPSGDELFVQMVTLSPTSTTMERFTRAADGTWSLAASVDFGGLDVTDMSMPTAGALGRHIIVVTGDGLTHELSEASPDVWAPQSIYTTAELGLSAQPLAPTLTNDGLHLVFGPSSYVVGSDWIFFTGRSDITGRFELPEMVDSAPMLTPAYLEAGCGRLYVIDNGHLEYVQQL